MQANRMLNVLTSALLLSAALVTVAAAEDAAPARPDVSGHWVLNEKASDFPRPGAGGAGGGFGGRGMGGGRRGRSGGGEMGGGMRGGMRAGAGGPDGATGGGAGETGGAPGGGRMGLPNDMVVELADSELTVNVRGLAVRKLEFGAAKPVAAPKDQAIPSLPARWEGARVVSEFENRRGGRMRETWEVSADGKQLVVSSALPAMGDRPAVAIKRVYDRVE